MENLPEPGFQYEAEFHSANRGKNEKLQGGRPPPQHLYQTHPCLVTPLCT